MDIPSPNIKEEAMSLNDRQRSDHQLVTPPKLSQGLLLVTDEIVKPNVNKDESPREKPKKQIAFQNVSENDRRDSRLQEMLREKRQSFMPGGSQPRGFRSSSPVKPLEKEVDVFKVKDEVKNKKIEQIENFLESKAFQGPVTLLTVYALFFGDIKYLISTKEDDLAFDVITFICMATFVFEIILSMLAKKNYTFSFFFWLDILSTVTLIFDLSLVSTNIFGNSTSLARASRATKIGSRAGRVIRLIRLIRIVKLWKTFKSQEEQLALRRIQNDPNLESLTRPKPPAIMINGPRNPNNDSVIEVSPSQISPNSPVPLNAPNHTAKSPSVFQIKVMPVGTGQENEILENNSQIENNSNNNTLNNNNIPNLSIMARNPSFLPKYSSATYRSPSVSPGRLSEWDRMQNLDDKEEENDTKESRVGKKLSELTTKRVVILVLILIFLVPLFQSSYYYDPDKGYTIGIKFLASMANTVTDTDYRKMFNEYISYYEGTSEPLAYVYSPRLSLTYQLISPDDLRDDEQEVTAVTVSNYSQDFIAVLDYREKMQLNALINITRTIFVCIVLTMAAYYFTKDANDLALKPIERMIEKVNKIASNPLASKEETIKEGKGGMQYETTLIENAIIKIGTLLALGFGEAGSEIIASNMAKGGDVDPMIAGKRQFAVFGFCDIRSFTDTTEVLQEEVMMFVNSIAEIVHKTVDKYGGAANKNIGDAFLLVYKFPPDEIITLGDGSMDIKRSKLSKNIADLSLISFLKIIAGINKKPQVMKYRLNEKLCGRMPNYKVKMGFGLHFGWAIEGAIGSEFKIDASYLSPNVNMASRLEAATKQYGVPLLISSELHRVLSKKTQRYCREIDRVTVKGSNKPVGLFTVDVDISVLIPSEEKGYTKMELKEKHRNAKANVMDLVFSNEEGGIKASTYFDIDNDLRKMTENVFGVFRNTFSEAFDNYVRGDWGACKTQLDLCFNQRPEDGPSTTLSAVLKEYNYMAPPDWKGYRVLTEK